MIRLFLTEASVLVFFWFASFSQKHQFPYTTNDDDVKQHPQYNIMAGWIVTRIDNKQKRDKTTNNELQNTTQKTKDWATRTQLKTCSELLCFGRNNAKTCTYSYQHNLNYHNRPQTWWQYKHGQYTYHIQ